MPFISYLIKRFEFTHENTFFREFSEKLQTLYENKQGLHILIGNISCQGHQIDAIFIRSGQITVIDFKDYSGRLEFSENNPWRIFSNNGELVFVSGGSQIRNPYQQVNAYRHSLKTFLHDNENSILEPNRNNFKWNYISSIVLFQRNIEFDNNQIPATIQRYFTVADKDNAYNKIEDRNSADLKLNDKEIKSICEILNVRSENIFNPNLDPIPVANNNDHIPIQRFEQLRRFISGNNETSIIKKAINYYRALLQIERANEPIAGVLYPYPINWREINNTIEIDITLSPHFYPAFLNNRQERFPKNLFIGVNININGNTKPLFHTIILNSDVQNPNQITFNIHTLDIYLKSLEDFGLSEDIIEELLTTINQEHNFKNKLQKLRDFLGVPAEITQSLSIGLSNESLFTAQLLSELKKLSQKNDTELYNVVFKSFILNKEIEQESVPFNFNPLIHITPLNSSQEKALNLSFSQPLTVITGPPGTGKSQVVLNLIANAIANNKSILFASKNNKAVDNVKERFDNINKESYLLRFGSAAELQQQTIPKIDQFINNINIGNYEIEDNSVNELKHEINSKNNRINELKKLLESIPELSQKIESQHFNLGQLKDNYSNWLTTLDINLKQIFIEQDITIDIDLNALGLIITQLKKINKNHLYKILFNVFYKKRLLNKTKSINSTLHKTITDLINFNSPYVDVNKTLALSLYDNCNFILRLIQQSYIIKQKNSDFINKKNNLETSLLADQNQFEYIQKSQSIFEDEIKNIIDGLSELGSQFLNNIIKYKIAIANVPVLQIFKDFLPANQLWRDEDIEHFEISCENFLNTFNAVCLTSLSVKNSFSLSSELFDLLVIDEASQCDVASALPLIFRAKKIVIIGDPLQLKHITNIKQYEEEYVIDQYHLATNQLKYSSQSLYDFANGISNKSRLESVFLEEHFRSHHSIINYSNLHFYQRKLGQTLKIKTTEDQFQFMPKGITWENVIGTVEENRNVNNQEVKKSIELARTLSQNYPHASIGIVTPFKHQYQAIFNSIDNNLKDRVKVDTVHKFQGDEKDIIIFSLVVSNNCRTTLPNFINEYAPYLLNVGITRARSTLIIVGNYNYCLNLRNGPTKTILCHLAEYVRGLNRVEN